MKGLSHAMQEGNRCTLPKMVAPACVTAWGSQYDNNVYQQQFKSEVIQLASSWKARGLHSPPHL